MDEFQIDLQLREAFQTVTHLSAKKGKKKSSSSLEPKIQNGGMELSWNEYEIENVPSAFAAFCHVRKLVRAAQWLAGKKGTSLSKLLTEQDDALLPKEASNTDVTNKQTDTASIPRTVIYAVQSIFDLVKESWILQPVLCAKVLRALLDILQHQAPESLRNEPEEVIEPLFKLLLELSCTSIKEDEAAGNDSGELSALATSCLLSLVVAWASTPKLLTAITALVTKCQRLPGEEVKAPQILLSLQKSVQGITTGVQVPMSEFLNSGIPNSSLVAEFELDVTSDVKQAPVNVHSVASDGKYLYLNATQGLYKIGTGFGQSTEGRIYGHRQKIMNGDLQGQLLFINGELCLTKTHSKEVVVIDRATLRPRNKFSLDFGAESITFATDGVRVGSVFCTREDEYVVRMRQLEEDQKSFEDFPLQLTVQSVYCTGVSLIDSETTLRSIYSHYDNKVVSVCGGKEFSLLTTAAGKVYYQGKSSSLGFKGNLCDVPESGSGDGSSQKAWRELPLPKTPHIVQAAVGHEGHHTVLVDSEGNAYFAGLGRRGEDGDLGKNRRQSQPSLPKKFLSMDGRHVILAACNSGTSALVTKDGALYVFGVNAPACDAKTGRVTGLQGAEVVQVALGKAHGVILTKQGHVHTYGVNIKGQCGRDNPVASSTPVAEESAPPDFAAAVAAEGEAEDGDTESEDCADVSSEVHLCPPGEHRWRLEQCMVCSICGQCTGYGAECLNSGKPGRGRGSICGCGSGDSGCSACGACRQCAEEPPQPPIAIPIQPGAQVPFSAGYMRANGRLLMGRLIRAPLNALNNGGLPEDIRAREVTPVDALVGAALQQEFSDAERRQRHRHRRGEHAEGRVPGRVKQPTRMWRAQKEEKRQKEVPAGDADRETSKIALLPLGKVTLPPAVGITQIVCGLHHTLLLSQSGEVWGFGSNSHGQLGVGDLVVRGSPTPMKLPAGVRVAMVAAGSHHSVLLTSTGEVLTCGAYQKGQLNREGEPGLLHSLPLPIARIGSKFGRKATWVGASGDQTFIRIDESLVSEKQLQQSVVLPTAQAFVVLPTTPGASFRSLVINKNGGQCRTFAGAEQVEFSDSVATWDSSYGIIWSVHKKTLLVRGCNVLASRSAHSAMRESLLPHLSSPEVPDVFHPALALPQAANATVAHTQAALYLLCSVETLIRANRLKLSCDNHEDKRKALTKRVYSKEDFSVVNRFEGHGGGWGYSGHSVEAIRFMADADVLLAGFGLFGGRGEYMGKIKLFDLGPLGGDQESDGELLAESEEVVYECGARQRYPLFFAEPVTLQANRWYLAWARVNGPSSDCGSNGHTAVTTEDQVVFTFKSSKKSNNGTDVHAGQIPQLYYRIVAPEFSSAPEMTVPGDKIAAVSPSFVRTVTPECFTALLSLLEWAWSSLIDVGIDLKETGVPETLQECARFVFVCRASFRIMKFHMLEVFPVKGKPSVTESRDLAEAAADVRATIRNILSDPVATGLRNRMDLPREYNEMLDRVFAEAHDTFVSCFHAFFPRPRLMWAALCDLLDQTNKSDGVISSLVAAVLDALCSPHIKLRTVLPNVGESAERTAKLARQPYSSSEGEQTPSTTPSDNSSSSPLLQQNEASTYPLLVEHMLYRSQAEGLHLTERPFRAILEKLLYIAALPIKQRLEGQATTLPHLLVRHACRLISRVVAELALQASGSEDLDLGGVYTQHVTPSRFSIVSPNRSWNTGNGAPDAICFSVNRANIMIAGAVVFGGGGTYNYVLELLEQGNNSGSAANAVSWDCLAEAHGVYGPDDCVNDTAEIKFDRPVAIKENVKYALRLRNQGGKTHNGDGGSGCVTGPDGTVFTFSTCALSFNGTNIIRGQIPSVLYFSLPVPAEVQQTKMSTIEAQARQNVLSIASAVIRCSAELLSTARLLSPSHTLPILASADIISSLIPHVVASIAPVAKSDPKSAVLALGLVQEILPHVSSLCLADVLKKEASREQIEAAVNTTSQHVAWVESEHPYRPATVSHYRVCFPRSVAWLCLEFDSSCATAQNEDVLQLYIPSGTHSGSSTGYHPVLQKYHGSSNWPSTAIILPGNEVLFSLETASEYIRNEKASSWGFRCLVTGYEWPDAVSGIRHLEKELGYLGGMCVASLMKKDLALTSYGDENDLDPDLFEEKAQQIFNSHIGLLGKGLDLAHLPTIQEALDGSLPYSTSGKERQFLRDFVQAAPGTSGGRLARWLQPESVVDPGRCLLIFPGVFSASVANLTAGFNALAEGTDVNDVGKTTIVSEGLLAGWPTVLTLLTRDQYGNLVDVPNLKVEIKAVPADLSSKTWTTRPSIGQETFGGHPSPVLDVRYELTVKDKARYHAIAFMKDYENYSFEELRFMSPAVRRSSETMLVRANADGTYSANWTPSSSGSYTIHVTIDGYPLSDAYKAEVKEPPEGIQPPASQAVQRDTPGTKMRMLQFRTRSSAGLRIRAQPSLQAEQIGVLAYEGIISYVEELRNDDGLWVRLSSESTQDWCSGRYPEAWCLQHNQHYGKTLLFPLQETPGSATRAEAANDSKSTPKSRESSTKRPATHRGRPGLYYVVRCGASGHNIRAKPYLKAPSVGKLNLGDRVVVADSQETGEGLWVKLSSSSLKQYCFSTESAAWSLAANKGDITYLQHEDDYSKEHTRMESLGSPVPAFDFSQSADKKADISAFSSSPEAGFSFGPEKGAIPKISRPGSTQQPAESAPEASQSLESSGENQLGGSCGPLAAAAAGRISALQKWLRRDDRQAPPPTPPKEQKPAVSSRSVPPELQGVSVKDLVRVMGESRVNGNGKTPPASPLPARRNTRSSSAYGPEIAVSDSLQRSRSLSPAVSAGSDGKKQPARERSVSQTATQTSPEASKTQFNIGTTSQRADVGRVSPRVSPKLGRKERSSRSIRSRRSQTPPTRLIPSEPVRQGLSPSTAECLRAVFAACLWHSGTVHDAMACASFLKFHPSLPKQLDTVVLRTEKDPKERKSKEEKARQRHSVEVSSGSYLAAQYSSVLPTALEESWTSEKNEPSSSPQPKTVPLLPPALRLLVETWDKLSEFCVSTIKMSTTSNAAAANNLESSPTSETKDRERDKDRDRDKEKRRKLHRSSIRHSAIPCELCGTAFPPPVVHHLRKCHPGCNKPSRGMGYNSDGQYCGVGIGSCGDTSSNGSSYYFMCDPCRRLHSLQRSQGQQPDVKKEDKPKRTKKKSSTSAGAEKSSSGPMKEMHLTMKENAMFLLHLCSAAGDAMSAPEKRKRSLLQQSSLASVAELPQLKRRSLASTPSFPTQQFQCLAALRSAAQHQGAPCDSTTNDTETDNSFEEVFQQAGSPPQTDPSGRPFHRSVSMVTQPLADHLRTTREEVSPSENGANRRRAVSGEATGLDGGLSFLCTPSKALQQLVTDITPVAASISSMVPVLRFVTQRYDLQALQSCMERSVRKSACRVYAMQSMTWLLRAVSQPVCLHDLLWWLVASLAPVSQSTEENACREKEHLVGEHPVSDVTLAGGGVAPLLTAFHGLLQTIADLMQHLPMGSPLLQMAIKCWDVRFKPSDHAFLHRSHVFSNISRILSRCEDEAQTEVELPRDALLEDIPFVDSLCDMTATAKIEVSSRSGMASSLTDGSTETFWESGDEDTNKLVTVALKQGQGFPKLVSVHIDNGRDLLNKVTRIKVTAGPSFFALKAIETAEVDKRFAGWVHFFIQDVGASVIQLEFRGPENKIRVRQIRLLKDSTGPVRSFCTTSIQQRICEAETLRVFRLLTSQVFGRLVSYEEGAPQQGATEATSAEADVDEMDRNEDNDLKEHMVGILFSGKKLSHLQRQVCSHIVQGIRSETLRLREEWEAALAATPTGSEHAHGRISDSFCFELLSQVLALSGSRVGRTYIAQQPTLPADLLSLLHTGSPRIQRQVTSLLRRVLPELPPEVFASLIGVSTLPSADYGMLQNAESPCAADRVGILDVFLACISKALTVQVKTRGADRESSKAVTSMTMSSVYDPLTDQGPGLRWWMRGSMPKGVAESIVQLLIDLASGQINEAWAVVTKAAIADIVMSLTKVDEKERTSVNCLRKSQLWLALAALCLLQEEHVEKLSSAQWTGQKGSATRLMCANHDDGETGAQLICADCGPLCAECDRVLHLHRKNRHHQRQVCKEEEEAIRVDVHEGCGRVKLFWLLALSDARSLKSLVEFRNRGEVSLLPAQPLSSAACRFCGSPAVPALFGSSNLCSSPECQEYGSTACSKTLSCGHLCGGVVEEVKCLPCLNGCSRDTMLKQDADDMCMICFTEALSAAPAIQLKCGHVFHAHCCQTVLVRRWPGPRITFGFSMCPICKAAMEHPYLLDLLSPISELFDDVRRKALMRLEYEGLHQAEALVTLGGKFYNDPVGFAMDRYAYYVCYKCNKAYYGGEARCEAEAAAGGESFDPAELVCGGCSDVSRAQMCPRHGSDFLEYKCRYCCSVAVFFCFGTTHFCNPCHDDFRQVTKLPQSALPQCPAGPRGQQLEGDECPLHVKHPPTGEEFALGCGICRNAHTF